MTAPTPWVQCPDCVATVHDVGPVGSTGRAIVVEHSPTCPQLVARQHAARATVVDGLRQRLAGRAR